MGLRFNPPPNWPKPPEGWRPDRGWRPDPQWGPAPQGWPFWVDQQGNPVASDRPEDPSVVPEEPGSSPTGQAGSQSFAQDQPATGDDRSTGGGSSAASGAGASAAPGSSAEGVSPEGEPGDAGAAGAAAGASAGSSQAGPGPNHGQGHDPRPGSGNEFQRGAENSGSPETQQYPQQAWGESPQNNQQGHQYAGQYAPNGQQGNQWNQPPKKKNFFTSAAGILSIIGAVLLILIVLLVLALTGVIGGHKDDSETSQAASNSSAASSSSDSDASGGSSESASAQASASGQGPSGTKPEQKNIPANDATPVVEFSGSGDQTVKTDKLADDKIYYVDYWYEGESNFAIWGVDDKGERGGLYANDIDSSVGSSWLDQMGIYGNPKALTVEGDGKWEMKVYDSNAVQSKGDKTLGSTGTVAFAYQGPKKTGSFTNLGDESVQVEAYNLKGDSVFHENVEEGKKATLDFPDAVKDDQTVLVQVSTTHADTAWKIEYH